jgi:hypothetical protein
MGKICRIYAKPPVFCGFRNLVTIAIFDMQRSLVTTVTTLHQCKWFTEVRAFLENAKSYTSPDAYI